MINSQEPAGIISNAGIPNSHTSFHCALGIALGVSCIAGTNSINAAIGIPIVGPQSRLNIGALIIADPKPAKPLISPAVNKVIDAMARSMFQIPDGNKLIVSFMLNQLNYWPTCLFGVIRVVSNK